MYSNMLYVTFLLLERLRCKKYPISYIVMSMRWVPQSAGPEAAIPLAPP
jgi:hypothetical protein